MDRLSELLGNAVQFAYTCWDRIVLSGYIERLQRAENLIYFFHEVVGIDTIEPAVLDQRTKAYRAWVRRITEERGIPVVAAPRGVRKEELVEPYYRRLKGDQGVACVLTSLEQGRTFVSYVPRRSEHSSSEPVNSVCWSAAPIGRRISSLRATHQPPLSGQAANCAGPARRRTPGAALVLPDVIRQTVRPRRPAQRSDPPNRNLLERHPSLRRGPSPRKPSAASRQTGRHQ